MRETDADRSWQAGHGQPWTSRRDEQGRSNARQSCYSPWQLIKRIWEHSARTFLCRENSDSEGDASKVETQKRKHSVHAYFHKNQERSILQAEKYDDLITAEHKVFNEGRESRNNHRCAAVVQVLATQWNPCQAKTSQETEKNLRKFTEAKSYPYVQFILIWQVLWRIIMESHRTATPHQSETSEIAGRAVRLIKEVTSAVLLQSGLNKQWWSDSMECYCCLRDDQDLLADGKSQNERRFGESFWDMLCSRVRIWEKDFLIAEIEELKKLDASETYPRRLNAKEVLITQKDGEFVFLVVQQNYQEETTNSKNPLWDGNPP